MKGAKVRGRPKLMVVGRAVNGWDDEGRFKASELRDHDRRNAAVSRISTIATGTSRGRGCPLVWIAQDWGSGTRVNYDPTRSPFWRVARLIGEGLGAFDLATDSASWSSHLVWSNLAKAAPWGGGNPSNDLYNAQFPACKKLLLAEIQRFKPEHLLIVAGMTWACDFLDDSPFVGKQRSGQSSVQWQGTIQNGAATTKVVVTRRPEGKAEAPFVKAAIKAFSSLRPPQKETE